MPGVVPLHSVYPHVLVSYLIIFLLQLSPVSVIFLVRKNLDVSKEPSCLVPSPSVSCVKPCPRLLAAIFSCLSLLHLSLMSSVFLLGMLRQLILSLLHLFTVWIVSSWFEAWGSCRHSAATRMETKFKFKFKSFIESRTDKSTWIANAIKG